MLYIGDVMGPAGLKTVQSVLPKIRREHAIDFVVAQAENLSDGRGITRRDFKLLQAAGVDFCTGGNWTLHNPDIYDYLNDSQQPIIRPANYPAGTTGLGCKTWPSKKGLVRVVSLLGDIVGKDSDKPIDNPLQRVDAILETTNEQPVIATIINFHGDYSSQKVIIGHYLDGRASLVVGDHWHVPTADARILPKGTAHQTDVGMCGVLNSSLGVSLDSVVPRWRDGRHTPNQLETKGPWQFNAILVTIDTASGLATECRPINQLLTAL